MASRKFMRGIRGYNADGTLVEFEAKDVTEASATRVCAGYGWSKYSAAWHTLAAGWQDADPKWLMDEAKLLHPDCVQFEMIKHSD